MLIAMKCGFRCIFNLTSIFQTHLFGNLWQKPEVFTIDKPEEATITIRQVMLPTY